MSKLTLSAIILALILCFCIIGVVRGEEITPLSVAISEIGKGEQGSNNRGPDIKRYGQGKDGQPWCATFVSYCLNEAGITDLGYPVAAKVIWNKGRKAGWQVNEPQPGDLICFWRGKKNGWTGHIEIIEQVKGGKVITVAGNLGEYPSKVKRIEYDLDNIPRLLGFVRPEK